MHHSFDSARNVRRQLSLIARLFVAALLALAFSFSFSSCSKEDEPEPQPVKEARRTVLIYMVAQNSLGSKGYQKQDSTEIMAAHEAIADDDNLLLFIDDAQNPRIYAVTAKESEPRLLRSWDADVQSTSATFFSSLLSWVKDYYPAREYGLVMWSHATGWVPAINPADSDEQATAASKRRSASLNSFGLDDGWDSEKTATDKGKEMNVSDIAQALMNADFHAKYIFFDACLMQNLEVAYALRGVADHVVGAPVQTPAAGSNYTSQIKNGLFSNDISDIVNTYYADVTDEAQHATYIDFGIVISDIRTDKLQELADTVKSALPHSALLNRRSPALSSVTSYQSYTSVYKYRPHNYDAAEAVRAVFEEPYASRVLRVLSEAVVSKAATPTVWVGPGWKYINVNLNTYSGVSMFIPQDVYTENAADCPYGDLNTAFQSTDWYKACGWSVTGW